MINSKTMFYIFIVFAMIFWGASWVNVKFLSSYVNEYELIILRMGISFICMLPIIFFLRHKISIDFKTIFLVLLASISLVSYSIVFFLGVDHGTAGFGGALVTTLIPINTFLILAVLNKKSISIKHSLALALGAFGVLTMLNIWSFDINEIFSIENIYFLLASIFWPILTIVSSKNTRTSPLVFTFYVYILSSIFISLFYVDLGVLSQEIFTFDYVFWLNLFVITILATVFASTIYFIGINKLGTNEVSSFVFLVPSSALILSAIFLDEKITFTTIFGMICTIIAIYILNNLSLFKLFRK
ncbi:MAG: DMT family transporter [Sulfurovum sp.]